MSRIRTVALAMIASTTLLRAQAALDSSSVASFHFRFVGPEGNRVTSIAGVNGDPTVYYAGAASGGLWKTTDGGIHWKPIFDGQPVSSIGSVTVAPSDPNVVWVGTGEPFIRSHISVGWGMFKSTDAGATWSRAGLEATGRIARIVDRPARSGARLRRRTRPRLRPAAGARHIPHHRWRQDVGESPLRRTIPPAPWTS